MAILVRASFQMREFEDRFVTLGLNYRVIGGPRFYERQEIRDALAYFRVVAQAAPTTSPSSASSTCRSAASAKPRSARSTTPRARSACRCWRRPAKLAESDELKPKPRAALREVAANFARWQELLETTPHTELAEIILEESGYTEMWKNDRSAEAPGRLENLKELIRSMEEYESLRSFLEHVALVMDAEQNEELDAVSIMTLHSAKGLEFETVFLPGWEEGLFPHQRALDEGGRSGLEEERRLAYVGLTRAKQNLHHLVRLQPPHPRPVAIDHPVALPRRTAGGACRGGGSRQFLWRLRLRPLWRRRLRRRAAAAAPLRRLALRQGRQRRFSNTYATPGWQRAQQNRTEATDRNWGSRSGHQVERIGYGETDSGYGAGRGSVKGRTIDGELVAKSVADTPSPFNVGDRVFHQKFGNGNVAAIEGNKLTIDFDRAGQKKVLDGFVQAA